MQRYKDSPLHATKACGGSRSVAPLVLPMHQMEVSDYSAPPPQQGCLDLDVSGMI
jgi:hypothetical protein